MWNGRTSGGQIPQHWAAMIDGRRGRGCCWTGARTPARDRGGATVPRPGRDPKPVVEGLTLGVDSAEKVGSRTMVSILEDE